jgi:16S rRNA (adenine1518-N6/adenine1519-N6)-dimethyltransferase
MEPINYNAPSSIKAFLHERSLSPRKMFGQHFLINQNARAALIRSLAIHEGDAVWEIGPGLGAMTRPLLDVGAVLTAFEIDRGYSASLRELFMQEMSEKRFTLIEGDCLSSWKTAVHDPNRPLFLLGNLPYNIAGALIGDFIENGRLFVRAAVTVQKETAARIGAGCGDTDYSSLSVLCALFYSVQKIVSMPGTFFYPPPKVDSTGLLFEQKKDAPKLPRLFFPLTRALFASRRKTVYNNLRRFLALSGAADGSPPGDAAFCEEALLACGAVKTMRPEEFSPSQFAGLAEFLAERAGKQAAHNRTDGGT